jgi:hypothetical protein
MLDFRVESKEVREPKEGIWYILYNSSYTEATILRMGKANMRIYFQGDAIPTSSGLCSFIFST